VLFYQNIRQCGTAAHRQSWLKGYQKHLHFFAKKFKQALIFKLNKKRFTAYKKALRQIFYEKFRRIFAYTKPFVYVCYENIRML
jgi:hypothetical protein